MTSPSVFVDTNVWFSAIYGSPNSEKIIEKYLEGKITLVASRTVVNELIKNALKKIPHAEVALKQTLENRPPKIVRDPETISIPVKKYVHLKDRLIFQAAVDSKSDWFVTGNLKDFDRNKLKNKFKIKIVSPKEFLKA